MTERFFANGQWWVETDNISDDDTICIIGPRMLVVPSIVTKSGDTETWTEKYYVPEPDLSTHLRPST